MFFKIQLPTPTPPSPITFQRPLIVDTCLLRNVLITDCKAGEIVTCSLSSTLQAFKIVLIRKFMDPYVWMILCFSGRFCIQNFPAVIVTSGHELYIHFRARSNAKENSRRRFNGTFLTYSTGTNTMHYRLDRTCTKTQTPPVSPLPTLPCSFSSPLKL